MGRKVLESEDAVVVEKKAGKTRCSQQCNLLNSLNYVPELLEQSMVAISVSSLSRLNKTILAHYSRFNKIATLGYIMAHEGMGTDHYSMS